MNDAMSFGIHRLWKDHYVSKLDPQGGLKCLDVAGGTGDIAMRILDHARTNYGDRDTSVAMLDINPEMLQEGKKRFAQTMYHNSAFPFLFLSFSGLLCALCDSQRFASARGAVSYSTVAAGSATMLHGLNPPTPTPAAPQVSFHLGNAEHLSDFADNTFDQYTIAFGIRNCTHVDRVLKEARELTPLGRDFGGCESRRV